MKPVERMAVSKGETGREEAAIPHSLAKSDPNTLGVLGDFYAGIADV
jgi:hypothetical protein